MHSSSIRYSSLSGTLSGDHLHVKKSGLHATSAPKHASKCAAAPIAAHGGVALTHSVLTKAPQPAGRPVVLAGVQPGPFLRGLIRLESLLASLPRHKRQQAVEALSCRLRVALASQMEARRGSKVPLLPRSPPVAALEKAEGVAPALVVPLVVPTEAPQPQKRRGVCPPAARCGKKTQREGVCKLHQSDRVTYFARITIGGIAINSKRVFELPVALQLRELLEEVRDQASPMHRQARDQHLCAAFSASSPHSCAAAAALRGNHAAAAAAIWSFRAVVDARIWTGRFLSTHRCGSIDEALLWHGRLDRARREGWEALRATWAECMPRAAALPPAPLALRPCGSEAAPSVSGCILPPTPPAFAAEGVVPPAPTKRKLPRVPYEVASCDAAKSAKALATGIEADSVAPRKKARLSPEARLQVLDTCHAAFQARRGERAAARAARAAARAEQRHRSLEAQLIRLVQRLEKALPSPCSKRLHRHTTAVRHRAAAMKVAGKIQAKH